MNENSLKNKVKSKTNENWTKKKIGEHGKEYISSFPHSIELTVGNKKVGLCHFPNDVRFDFEYHTTSTWAYQNNFD